MRLKDYDYGTYTNATCFCNGTKYKGEGEYFESPSKLYNQIITGYCLLEEPLFTGVNRYKDSLEIIQGGDDIDVEIDTFFYFFLKWPLMEKIYSFQDIMLLLDKLIHLIKMEIKLLLISLC